MADISRITEVRWFCKGRIRADVVHWFNDDSRLDDPLRNVDAEEMEHLYLIAAGGPEVSAKLREEANLR